MLQPLATRKDLDGAVLRQQELTYQQIQSLHQHPLCLCAGSQLESWTPSRRLYDRTPQYVYKTAKKSVCSRTNEMDPEEMLLLYQLPFVIQQKQLPRKANL